MNVEIEIKQLWWVIVLVLLTFVVMAFVLVGFDAKLDILEQRVEVLEQRLTFEIQPAMVGDTFNPLERIEAQLAVVASLSCTNLMYLQPLYGIEPTSVEQCMTMVQAFTDDLLEGMKSYPELQGLS